MSAVDHRQPITRADFRSRWTFESLPKGVWLSLFSKIAVGDEEAMDRLYGLSVRKLYGLALWRTASGEDTSCHIWRCRSSMNRSETERSSSWTRGAK